MNTLAILLVLATALLIIFALYLMQKKHLSFTKRVLTALAAGIAFGAILQLVFTTESDVISSSNVWISIVGSGYVRLLNMIVIPLVFVAITTSIVNQDSNSLKKSAATILIVLIATTAIATGIGASVASVFQLDSSELLAGQAESERAEFLEGRLDEFQSK